MPVILTTGKHRATGADADYRCVIGGGGGADLPQVPGLPAELEAAFEETKAAWLDCARELSSVPSAVVAHTPSAASNLSDFGAMLAWTRLVEKWAAGTRRVNVICDDPWMFRHLMPVPGVRASAPPSLFRAAARLAVRGILARSRYAMKAATAALSCRHQRRAAGGRRSWILVYGHPASNTGGFDGYFGRLYGELPAVARALHVDCPPRRARQLAEDGRTVSLHAWGNPLAALALIGARWQPNGAQRTGRFGWLIRRARALEGGTAQAASVAWQIHCQERWLDGVRPERVAWPWENHGWERAFVRACRPRGVRSVGYQHALVGHQELNYGVGSNAHPDEELPDSIVCSGPAGMAALIGRGVPEDRLSVGGALRFEAARMPSHDANGPILVALPSDRRAAGELVDAVAPLAGEFKFAVREHPMATKPIVLPRALRGPVSDQNGGIAGMIFAASTIGLEAMAAGLPVARFRPLAALTMDTLPDGVSVPVADADDLRSVFSAWCAGESAETRVRLEDFLAPPDRESWRSLLDS